METDKKTKIIGITGGIGSGKSAVTNRLTALGYPVVDADEVARESARPGEPCMLMLREEIGDGVFLENGELNRQALAKLMFYDPMTLMTVNEIFHGDIRNRIEARINEIEKGDVKGGTIFLSVPLLFESGVDWDTDEVWLVTADEGIRLVRVMKRDGMSEADVRARMENQWPEEEKRALADIVIENNGTLKELYQIVDGLLGRTVTLFSNH